jgi:hypothetical protein
MKNILLKTCLTALALSVAGLANAQAADMTPDDMLTYSVISGGAVNIAAQPDYVTAPNVGGHLAGQAAVTIGAFTTVNDIYAGAAVTTGASSRVKQIHAGAAAGVGANAYAHDVDAGAAVVVGAGGAVGDIIAGAAITLGAGATYYSTPIDAVVTEGAGSMDVSPENGGYTDDGVIVVAADMNAAMEAINAKSVDNPVDVNEVETYTDLSGLTIGDGGAETTVYYSAINLQANTTLTIEGNVTVITSESMTMGAGAEIVLEDGATVTWILGGSLNLGAGSKFSGETYVNGAVNGATSDVVCGNLFATGAVSVNTIGNRCTAPPDVAMEAINAKFVDNPVDVNEVETYTDLSGLTIGVDGEETKVYYSTITLQADSTLYVEGNVTVITSGSMTMGAGANIELVNGANVTWILGGALNLGAESKFSGETYVNGAVNGATSDVVCGNLFATGAVSVNTIGNRCLAPLPDPGRCRVWTVEDLQDIPVEFFTLVIKPMDMVMGAMSISSRHYIKYEVYYDTSGVQVARVTMNLEGIGYNNWLNLRTDTSDSGFTLAGDIIDSCRRILTDEINKRRP